MITKEMAIGLHTGTILHHVSCKNADGTSLRARVNGKCKTWVKNPEYWELPMKYGLYGYFYIKPGNSEEWELSD